MNKTLLVALILAGILYVTEGGNGKKKCKCPRKKKICENGEKPIFRNYLSPCSDGSRPRCPAKRCSKPAASSEETSLPTVIIKNITNIPFQQEFNFTIEPFLTEKHIDDFSHEEVKIGRKCKCPRKKKICKNGKKPVFRRPPLRCTDGSKPRCPGRRCSKFAKVEDVTKQNNITENDNATDSLLATSEGFAMELPNIVEPLSIFPKLFDVNSDENVSIYSQCQQIGIVSCKCVRLNTDLLETLTPGTVIMLVEGTDFTMELTNSASKLPSVAYNFQISTGGSGTMTVWQNEDLDKQPSVYAAVNTHGKGMYFVESCGTDCTVLYKRDSSFYNNLEDK